MVGRVKDSKLFGGLHSIGSLVRLSVRGRNRNLGERTLLILDLEGFGLGSGGSHIVRCSMAVVGRGSWVVSRW